MMMHYTLSNPRPLSQSASLQSALTLLPDLLISSDHLSDSIYDIAVCALYPGHNQLATLQWLVAHRNADGSWGDALSWQYRYLCTYAASIALLNSTEPHHDSLAHRALGQLPGIVDSYPDLWTSNFGGNIAALDRYARTVLGQVFEHPDVVQRDIAYDFKKWEKIAQLDMFYNPAVSAAGFMAEWAYLLPTVDLPRLLQAFQTPNGSLSTAPAASVFALLACEEHGICSESDAAVAKLRAYVQCLNPNRQVIGNMDQCPHFVTAWLLLFVDHQQMTMPDSPTVTALHTALAQHGTLISAVHDLTFPGDIDTTASSIIALNLPSAERAAIMSALESMFVAEHYLTFRHERTPAITTNVHAAAAWPENPHIDVILNWIAAELTRTNNRPQCKWHTSPYYTLGEMARLFPAIRHPVAADLACRAGEILLNDQKASGGWGWNIETHEETCYAVLALASLRRYGLCDDRTITSVISKAQHFLQTRPPDHSPLWVGKSLYYLPPLEQWLRVLALAA